MSFLLTCPLCGPRDVYEYRFGGEAQRRPAPGTSAADWGQYLYARTNVSGVEREWWFHRAGCRRWFQAERDTRDNRVLQTGWTITEPVAATRPAETTAGASTRQALTAGPRPALTAAAPDAEPAVEVGSTDG